MQTGPVKRISHHVALSKPIAFGHFGQNTSANKSALALWSQRQQKPAQECSTAVRNMAAAFGRGSSTERRRCPCGA